MDVRKKGPVQSVGFIGGVATVGGFTITPPPSTSFGDLLFLVITFTQGSGYAVAGNAKTWTNNFSGSSIAFVGVATGSDKITASGTFLGNDCWQLIVLRGPANAAHKTDKVIAIEPSSGLGACDGFTRGNSHKGVVTVAIDQLVNTSQSCVQPGFANLAPPQTANNATIRVAASLDASTYISGSTVAWANLAIGQTATLITYELQ